METQTIILGIDPGFHITGYSVASTDGHRTMLLDCGYLKMKPQHTLSQRVGQFYAFFKEKIEHYQTTAVALETSFLGKNAQTFLKLGYLRGILYLLADQHSLILYEFAPREIKMAVTGYGGASKKQVASMMLRLFPRLSEYGAIERADVTDALAICMCGMWHSRQASVLAPVLKNARL